MKEIGLTEEEWINFQHREGCTIIIWVILIFHIIVTVIDFICNIVVNFVYGLLMIVLVLVLVMVSGVQFLTVIDGGLNGVNFGGQLFIDGSVGTVIEILFQYWRWALLIGDVDDIW